MKGSVEKIREACAGRSPRPSALVYLIGTFHPGALGSEFGALMFESINPRHEQEWPIARPPNARPAALRAIPIGGRERIVARTDYRRAGFACSLTIDPGFFWMKLETFREGARVACQRLQRKSAV